MWSPSVDFSENEKEFIVRLEAPGVPKEDLEVNLEGQTLTISGRRDFEKEEKTEEYFWREREAGKFVRTLQLPTPIDRSKVTAVIRTGSRRSTCRRPSRAPRPGSDQVTRGRPPGPPPRRRLLVRLAPATAGTPMPRIEA
jgi:HSP20 family protein